MDRALPAVWRPVRAQILTHSKAPSIPRPTRRIETFRTRRGYSTGPQDGQSAPEQRGSSWGESGSSSSSAANSSSSSSSSKASLASPSRPSPLTPHLQRLQSTLSTQRALYEPRLRSELSRLGAKWNTYSGYDAIESAKQRVISAETQLSSLRKQLSSARSKYLETVDQRSNSQKTINDLLQRKASWSDEDLIKYTSLLRSEHSEARAEELAREEFDRAERQVAQAWDLVVKSTLERYHDEQVWSDRVRNVSSYTQLAVVGLNVFIFMLAIFLVEPYKRRKLAQTFEERLLKGEEQGRIALQEVITKFDQTVMTLHEELTEVKVAQKGLLAVAGVPQKRVEEGLKQHVEAAEPVPVTDQEQEENVLPDDDASTATATPRRIFNRVKRETRFLTHPASQQDKDRRRDIVAATGVGAVVTVVATVALRAILGG